MTLERAIKELEFAYKYLGEVEIPFELEAIKIGIEALKEIHVVRSYYDGHLGLDKLPSETEE